MRHGDLQMLNSRRAFTIIEVLVVVFIVAVLAALLYPILVNARERGRVGQCAENEKQLAVALLIYADDWGEVPGGAREIVAGDNEHVRTWDRAIWYIVKNRGVFHCPSDKRGTRSYSLNDQQSQMAASNGPEVPGTKLSQVPNPSKYVMLTEVHDPLNRMFSGCWVAMVGPHGGYHFAGDGGNEAFFDGHVKYYRDGELKISNYAYLQSQ